MLHTITYILNACIFGAFIVCFSYQAIYFFGRRKKLSFQEEKVRQKKYAVLIAARNESAVIGRLIESIQAQSYQGILDIFVVADNCTDDTARIAADLGACVYERQNREQVGKGYALQFLLNHLIMEQRLEKYDGYFIFDADNILRKNYVEEMNRTFCQGYQVVTSYRNSTNFGHNWITFGYGLWFLHEAEFLNKGRMHVGSSCMVSGTGYLISMDILRKNNGWNHFLLTEDIEFTADCILKDIKIGYCENAEFFDEQPLRFRDSWNQRLRWVKGYYQVFGKYSGRLFKKCVKERSLSCFDMLMVDLPAFLLTAIAAVTGISLLLIDIATNQTAGYTLYSIGMFFVKTFCMMFLLGIYTVWSQRKHIAVPKGKILLYLFTFPVFMYTYFPIALAALRRQVSWKEIPHGQTAISVFSGWSGRTGC